MAKTGEDQVQDIPKFEDTTPFITPKFEDTTPFNDSSLKKKESTIAGSDPSTSELAGSTSGLESSVLESQKGSEPNLQSATDESLVDQSSQPIPTLN